MKRYSLYSVILGILSILVVINFISIYFSVTQHREDLIESAIEEKTHLAEIIDETMTSPLWIYRLALVPGMEKAFIREITEFEDVKYIRIVTSDGTIYKSSIEEEWGKIIKEPDIYRVIESGKKIVKDQTFDGEKIKLIIYPGHQDKTIWVGFTLKRVEDSIRVMLIRDISFASGGLIAMLLVLFLTSKEVIVDPLKKLTEACKEIGKGNLDVKIETKSKTEIGELADTFNKMTLELSRAKKELMELNLHLEEKVKERTRQLKEAESQLIQSAKMATIGTLAGGVAHEINNPLGAILTNTQMLLMEVKDPEQQKELKLIEEGTKRCRDIVRTLLKYSRKPEFDEFKSINLNNIIADTCNLVQHQLDKENIKIEVEYGEIPNINGNSNELQQVFTNLILNARDAIKKTGKPGKITIRTFQEGIFIVSQVIDNGCGIPKENMDRIFDPFFTTKDVGEGTGLGLAISYKIIEKHSGKVEVSSKVDKGTTFTIRFPKVK